MKRSNLFIDDKVEISEDIKNMSEEELKKEIEKFEDAMLKRRYEKQKKVAFV